MTTPTARQTMTKGIFPLVLFVALVLPPSLLTARLPDPVAAHWALSGHPNGHAAWWGVTAVLVGLWLVAWVTLARFPGGQSRWLTGNIYALGGVLLATQIIVLHGNLDQASWQVARRLPVYVSLPSVLLLAIATGAVGWLMSGPQKAPAEPPPSAGLGPTERAVWVGRAHNHWLAGAIVVVTVAGVYVTGRTPFFVLVLLVAVVVVFSHVSVVVGPTGMTTTLGAFGWPRRQLGIDEITSARPVNASALAYGGWGWRRRPGRTGIIVRSGEALEVDLRRGGRLVVTVDDATVGAGLINDYVGRKVAPAAGS